MKKWMKQMSLVLLVFLLIFAAGVQAEEDEAQFPFFAQTNELAVNLRAQMDSASEAVGRLERGQQLTVLSAQMNEGGEVWYSVELEDGTAGYIRSDLLIPSELAQAELAAYQAANSDAQGEYIGNKNSKKFHLSTCHTLPKEKNRVYFESRDEAVEQGYEPCKNCKP